MQPVYDEQGIMLYRGDCLEIMPRLAPQSIDAVICDPPYGTTACAWDSVIPLDSMWSNIKRLLKPRGVVVLFGAQPFTSVLITSNIKWFKYQWIWEKTKAGDFMLAKYRPRMLHEDICVFFETRHTYNPQMVEGEPYTDKPRKRSHNVINFTMPKLGIVNEGWRYPSSVQKFSNANNHIVHPTQKPIDLMGYLVRTYTNAGDTVLDFTSGSGTTLEAALIEGRKCIGIERDEDENGNPLGYIDYTMQRLRGEKVKPITLDGKPAQVVQPNMFAA